MNEIPQTIPEEFLSLNSSPAYLFDLDAFAERIRRTRGYLKEQALLCYAIKASSSLRRPPGGLFSRRTAHLRAAWRSAGKDRALRRLER